MQHVSAFDIIYVQLGGTLQKQFGAFAVRVPCRFRFVGFDFGEVCSNLVGQSFPALFRRRYDVNSFGSSFLHSLHLQGFGLRLRKRACL